MARKRRKVPFDQSEDSRLTYLMQERGNQDGAWRKITDGFNRRAQDLNRPRRSESSLRNRYHYLQEHHPELLRRRRRTAPAAAEGDRGIGVHLAAIRSIAAENKKLRAQKLAYARIVKGLLAGCTVLRGQLTAAQRLLKA